MTADLDRDLARVLAAYESAVFAKDADALMRLYDPDVRVFDAWGVWSHEGADAWRRTVEGWFQSLGAERVKVRFDDVRTTTGNGMASVSAIVTYAGQSAAGEPLRAMQNRITWVLRTSGHVPRIVHEHTSAPIGFDDSKAILTRAPAG
ncbi:MAG: nuclear transport factor 2 family protein [Piscinibacter sp.]|nr:nuclear transport factor 2 family protein [Piscinibacter sp.]